MPKAVLPPLIRFACICSGLIAVPVDFAGSDCLLTFRTLHVGHVGMGASGFDKLSAGPQVLSYGPRLPALFKLASQLGGSGSFDGPARPFGA
jgi:hypothetical protein